MANKVLNFATANNFQVTIPELPVVTEFIQDIMIPGITLGSFELQNRLIDYEQPGEKMKFPAVDISFIVDENFDTIAECYNWMSTVGGVSLDEANRKLHWCDITVDLFTNNKNHIRSIVFTDCFPSALGALTLDSGDDGNLVGILTLEYTSWQLKQPRNNMTGYTTRTSETDIT